MRIVGIAVLVLALSGGFPSGRIAAQSAGVTLTVAGRSSQTPWAASIGSYVAVVWSAAAPNASPDVYLALSRDQGRTFDGPTRVNDIEGEARVGGELPPRVALLPRAGGGDPVVVVAYGSKTTGTSIKVVRSAPGGGGFGTPLSLQAAGVPGDRGWHAMTLDESGTAHVMWLDHRGLASGPAQSHAHAEKAAIDGVAMAERSGLYYAAVGAAGAPSEREVLKGVCYCCKVAMAAGRNGELFAAWRHVYPGNIRDIAFTSSQNRGGAFETPRRVSADDWHLAGCPDDGPAMTVDGEGTAHVVWPTVVNDGSGTGPEGALFLASSRDGQTFTPRLRIPTLGSPKPSHPQVLAEGSGGLLVAWDEVIDGVRRAATRRVTVDAAGRAAFGDVVRLGEAGAPSSYPMLVSTPRGPLAVYVSGRPGASVVRVDEVRPPE